MVWSSTRLGKAVHEQEIENSYQKPRGRQWETTSLYFSLDMTEIVQILSKYNGVNELLA